MRDEHRVRCSQVYKWTILEKEREEREREKKDVPIPITVPYSAFLSCGETAGGQSTMSAMKRKNAKERKEKRREECFLDGRAMVGEKCRGRDAPRLFICFRPRRLKCHVIHPKSHASSLDY